MKIEINMSTVIEMIVCAGFILKLLRYEYDVIVSDPK